MKLTNLIISFLSIILLSCKGSSKYPPIYIYDEEEESKPKIGLVLGGGGAKAAAEIGVLKVIDSLGIHIDYIVGSSMGSVVGGLYASGYSAKDIEELFLNEDWLALFDKREILSFADNGRDLLGKVPGDTIEKRLNEKLNYGNMENTIIPFYCTATEIVNNNSLKERILSRGPIAIAIHASMAWPAPIVGYSAVEIEGMKLVDGGMLNNLPVDVICDSVDYIIAIDLEQKQYNNHSRNELSFGGLIAEVADATEFGWLTGLDWLVKWLKDNPDWKTRHNNNVMEVKKEGNVYIKPKLDGYTIFSFKKEQQQQMIEHGESAAHRQIKQLELLR